MVNRGPGPRSAIGRARHDRACDTEGGRRRYDAKGDKEEGAGGHRSKGSKGERPCGYTERAAREHCGGRSTGRPLTRGHPQRVAGATPDNPVLARPATTLARCGGARRREALVAPTVGLGPGPGGPRALGAAASIQSTRCQLGRRQAACGRLPRPTLAMASSTPRSVRTLHRRRASRAGSARNFE